MTADPYQLILEQAYRDFDALRTQFASLPTEIKQNTWGIAVNIAAGGAIHFAKQSGIPQAHVNAIAHAYVSADLVYYTSTLTTTNGAINFATDMGDLKEFVPHIFGDSNPRDTLKDQWNNEIGREIGRYATDNGLTHDQMLALLKKAYLDGVIAKDELDTRIENDPSWEVTDSFAEQATTHCFTAGTMIDMWPVDASLKPDADGLYDKAKVLAHVWQKPIEEIVAADWVVSFDDDGNLKPGKVKRTFTNQAKIVLDFFGTGVTPGHAYYRADSRKACKFEPLIDILRDDGVVQNAEGVLIRAATGVPVGDPRDRFVWAVTGDRSADGRGVAVKARGQIRLGTRLISDDGVDVCVDDLIQAGGGTVTDEGLIRVGDAQIPLHWVYGDTLPRPEDYVLTRSGTTLEDIYKAAEWEGIRPHIPPPIVRDGGPVQPLSQAGLTLMPRNTPLAKHDEGYTASARPMLNRKQRKAAGAKGQQQAKAKKQTLN